MKSCYSVVISAGVRVSENPNLFTTFRNQVASRFSWFSSIGGHPERTSFIHPPPLLRRPAASLPESMTNAKENDFP